MTGRATQASAEPGHSLPVFDRLAPAPPPAILAAQIDLLTRPGDVVVDLAGRGGWVARAAIDRQRRGLSLESSPLTRMLAEIVLRPPDVRHLDAAFEGMAASPWRLGSLKTAIGDMYTTRCATCGRTLIAHEFTWSDDRQAGREAGRDEAGSDEPGTNEPGIRAPGIRDAGITARATPKPAIPTQAHPVLRHYRCSVCRDQLGGGELRQAPLGSDDLERATADRDADEARATIRQRFPEIPGAHALIDEMVAIHTARQLVAMAAILERIESDLREASVLAALRLSLLEAILPSSRLATAPGRAPLLRMAGGHVRLPSGTTFRERNPWLAFEEAFRTVRGFVQRLDGSLGAAQARLGEDLHALGEGHANAVLGLATASGVLTIRDGTYSVGRTGATPRVRLVIGQPPMRPSLDRLATAYHATAWVLGREAAALLPLEALAGSSTRPSWSWQAEALGRSLESVAEAMARDSRIVEIVDPGPEALVAAVLGGASAGCRLLDVRLGDADERDAPFIVEMLPPGGSMPPGPRTRANVALESVAGGAGDPNVVPGRGLFSPPERVRDRPFSATDTARTVTATAVETLRARGEPASFDRLLGAILIGLDRAGQLRRLADASLPGASGNGSDPNQSSPASADAHGGRAWSGGDGRATTPETRATPSSASDVVERLLTLIRDEVGRSSQRSLREIEPGTWWLADPHDVASASPPLADRLEWAVFSLLSTAGPLTENAFFERIASLFTGPDLPDDGLVRACLDSYRSRASTTDRLVTDDELLDRSREHTELIGLIAEAGHRQGMRIWIARREQSRHHGSGTLGDLLAPAEERPYLGRLGRAAPELMDVDVIWYVRGRLAFLFEVEWTAMMGETVLGRHAHIPPDDDLIRFLVIPPERTELVRYKLARSRLLRGAVENGNWHIVKSNHLRRFLARDPLELGDLEPYLGLDPAVERAGEQMPLFGT